jgi:hypothetical protein
MLRLLRQLLRLHEDGGHLAVSVEKSAAAISLRCQERVFSDSVAGDEWVSVCFPGNCRSGQHP